MLPVLVHVTEHQQRLHVCLDRAIRHALCLGVRLYLEALVQQHPVVDELLHLRRLNRLDTHLVVDRHRGAGRVDVVRLDDQLLAGGHPGGVPGRQLDEPLSGALGGVARSGNLVPRQHLLVGAGVVRRSDGGAGVVIEGDVVPACGLLAVGVLDVDLVVGRRGRVEAGERVAGGDLEITGLEREPAGVRAWLRLGGLAAGAAGQDTSGQREQNGGAKPEHGWSS
jgi:hypothetical protein